MSSGMVFRLEGSVPESRDPKQISYRKHQLRMRQLQEERAVARQAKFYDRLLGYAWVGFIAAISLNLVSARIRRRQFPFKHFKN
jgi:hypothetical protein